jgi:hypothetical protein
MASTLKVNEIQHINGTSALTIDTNGFVVPKTIMFSATCSSTQSMASGYTDYKMNLDTEEFDIGGYFDTTTYRFTPLVEGYYYITGGVMIQSTASIQARIYKNGSNFKIGSAIGTSAFGYNPATVTQLIYMNGTSDYLELYAVSSSGSQTTATGTYGSYFQGMLVGVS